MEDLKINFKRVYKGRITSIRQAFCDTLGYRGYEVMFSGKKMLYVCHKKTTLPISVGDTIRFIGEFKGEGSLRYFEITEVLDNLQVNNFQLALDLPAGDGFTPEQEDAMMGEEEMNKMLNEYVLQES